MVIQFTINLSVKISLSVKIFPFKYENVPGEPGGACWRISWRIVEINFRVECSFKLEAENFPSGHLSKLEVFGLVGKVGFIAYQPL